jgi:hypothetical protein
MLEGLKRFLLANLILFIAVIVILPPVGVALLGIFFVPALFVVGTAWLVQAARTIFARR